MMGHLKSDVLVGNQCGDFPSYTIISELRPLENKMFRSRLESGPTPIPVWTYWFNIFIRDNTGHIVGTGG